jgi:hypothetical protein|tara:strand:+ start:12485 stop:12769 length:285 start_codon:yes stop_codon:yes gene_type:complete
MIKTNLIEKENINKLNFINIDVLDDVDGKKSRYHNLRKAEILGNIHKRKIKIIFKSSEGIFKVETTVWARSEKYISLKGGVCIPISCIFEVSFF